MLYAKPPTSVKVSLRFGRVIAVLGMIGCLSWSAFGEPVRIYSGDDVEVWENGLPVEPNAYDGHDKDADGAEASESEQFNPPVGVGPSIPGNSSELRNDLSTIEQANLAEEDLEAQKSMAFWAQLMFWASAFSAIVSAIATVLIFLTLKATNKALVAARDANKSARDAVDVTQRIGEQQLAAYVTVEKAKVTRISETWNMGFQITGGLEAVNSGQTPAFDLQILTMFRWMTEEEIRKERIEKVATSKGVLGSGMTRAVSQVVKVSATSAEMTAYKAANKTLWFKGVLIYRDIHDQWWQHDFCWFFRDPDRIGISVDADNPDGRVMEFGMSAFVEGNTLRKIEQPKPDDTQVDL